MGEYTVDVGLHVDVGLCEITQNPNSVAVPLLRGLNMEKDACPPTAVSEIIYKTNI